MGGKVLMDSQGNKEMLQPEKHLLLDTEMSKMKVAKSH